MIETDDTVSGSWQQQQQQPYDRGILTIGCCGLYSPLHLAFVFHLVRAQFGKTGIRQ